MVGDRREHDLEDALIAKTKLRRAPHFASAFDRLAAELRQLTADRQQTPSEILLGEGRAER